MKKQTLVVLAAITLIGALLVTSIASGQGGRNSVVWEYGELLIQDELAFFTTQEELHELQPPSRRSSGSKSQSTDWGRVYYKTSSKLFHMNRIGQEGWEIISTAAIQDGFTYTVRRARR